MDFSGRTALVTGAAQGLGFALAEMLYESGASVVLVDRDPAVIAAAEKLSSDRGKALGHVADVTDAAAVSALRDWVKAELGAIDTLINNAGKYMPQKISEITEDDFDHIIAVNLKSTFLVTQAFMTDLSSHDSARVVNIASTDAHVPKVTNAHYAAAKAGVVSLTKTFAEELAPNVRVNGVNPGPIVTDTAKTQGWLQKAIAKSPLGRAAEPRDIGSVVLFLASRTNSYMNGETVMVNGGHTMI
jgi:3-oxoacyl-[acyl-carrier protein] reductase